MQGVIQDPEGKRDDCQAHQRAEVHGELFPDLVGQGRRIGASGRSVFHRSFT
ncbi:MAG: hypothetical protein USCGTAYLOR_00711 [Chromatiales bacterium USCg_Taylor]|nr:MAG: hypothetical protein USCGTAYLOR_00711 [Chromatiales bacterium USCg_Taylor]